MHNLVLEDLWENMANFIILSWHLYILDFWLYPPYLLKLIYAWATTIMAAVTGDAAVEDTDQADHHVQQQGGDALPHRSQLQHPVNLVLEVSILIPFS